MCVPPGRCEKRSPRGGQGALRAIDGPCPPASILGSGRRPPRRPKRGCQCRALRVRASHRWGRPQGARPLRTTHHASPGSRTASHQRDDQEPEQGTSRRSGRQRTPQPHDLTSPVARPLSGIRSLRGESALADQARRCSCRATSSRPSRASSSRGSPGSVPSGSRCRRAAVMIPEAPYRRALSRSR